MAVLDVNKPLCLRRASRGALSASSPIKSKKRVASDFGKDSGFFSAGAFSCYWWFVILSDTRWSLSKLHGCLV